MKVIVLEEHGFESALRGMAYSFKDRKLDPELWWETQKDRAIKRSSLLAPKEGGHNKFLESIGVWIDLEASRAFWSEFDTYRAGITKQSESTMHTLSKRPPEYSDFEVDTPIRMFHAFKAEWEYNKGNITALKQALPEGFLQRRVICTNYKTIKNIVQQRYNHRYKWWNVFIDELYSQLEHPELLPNLEHLS